MTKYPNRNALLDAYDRCKEAMREFICEYLEKRVYGETVEELIERISGREVRDIGVEGILDIFLDPNCWDDYFEERFGYDKQQRRIIYDIRSMIRMVKNARNKFSHIGADDLDPEFTRAHLFIIVDILREINKLDAKREVENIRDQLFYNKSEEHPLKAENAALKENLADMTKQRDAAEVERAELEKQVKTTSDRLKEVEAEQIASKKRLETASFRLKITEAGKTVAEERLSDISNRFEDAEIEKTELEKRLETTLAQLEEVEDELDDCNEELDRTREQLKELIDEIPEPLSPNPNTPDSITFHGTTFTKHFDQYCVTGDAITQSFWNYWHSLGPEGKEEMRDAGWSVEKVDDDYWEITISPEDFEAWVEEDDELLGPSAQLSSALTESIRPSYERTSLPTVKEMVQPALELFADRKEHRRVEMINRLTEHFSLDDDERRYISKTGQVEKHLMKEGLIERTRTGYYRITTRGLQVLK